MAKTPFKLNSNVFIDEYEKEIELSTKRNIDRIVDEKSLIKTHAKIVDILKSEGQNENQYLSIENYRSLVNKIKVEKQKKKELLENKEEQEG